LRSPESAIATCETEIEIVYSLDRETAKQRRQKSAEKT